jgi:uncharacterized protein (DUF1499 family)
LAADDRQHEGMRITLLLPLFSLLTVSAIRQDLSCPGTPNCVSTEATTESQRMAAIPFRDSPEAAQARARAALLAEARTVIVAEQPGVLRAEATSRIFRFVDDVVVVVDADARVFRFRSASRVGRSDLGVNRKRMTRVAARLAVTP